MRILVFHGYLLSGTGSNVYNAELGAAFVRAGHELHLLCKDRDPFALDWLTGEKMDLDPALSPIIREGLLRWDRVRLVRRGNLTPFDPWRNVTPLRAVLADVTGHEEPLWTAR